MTTNTSSALKTTAILVAAGAISAAALLLSQHPSGAANVPGLATIQASGQNSVLHLRTTLASTHVLTGSHKTYASITLTAPEQPHMTRPNVDLAIVFDRSGSMDGLKLTQAKLAARQLIGGLSEMDRFSVTAYGSDVDVLVPNIRATQRGKQAGLEAISKIFTDGGTNLSGGLIAGRSQLLALDGRASRVQRIILISDGEANEGIVGREPLARLASQSAEKGVSLTTVGVGLDFDEQTMTRIAVAGRGNYYFAENAGMLAELFRTELARLAGTVASQVRLRIERKAGVNVLEAIGYQMVREGDTVFVNIADMHAGETRKVILSMRVDAVGTGAMALADLQVSFVEPGSSEVSTLSTKLAAEVALSQSVVDSQRDKGANRLIQRALNAQAIEEATVFYERGNVAQAQQVMKARKMDAAPIAAGLGDTEFAKEMEESTDEVAASFAQAAAPESKAGKRLRKKNRSKAYGLSL